MTKTTRTAANPQESFHKHYAAIWGQERWETSLYPALAQPTRYTALVNNYASPDDFWEAVDSAGIPRENLHEFAFPALEASQSHAVSSLHCMVRDQATSEHSFPQPLEQNEVSRTHWNLDGASALVAHLLNCQPGDKVLDLCAAPGGKSVALAQSLWPHLRHDALETLRKPVSTLHANEIDGPRNKRLTKNLTSYLPGSLFQSGNILVSKIDVTQSKPGLNAIPNSEYDRVLVDAPCSSERHIIHAQVKANASRKVAPEMANWRPGSSKTLAKTQLEILLAACKAARIGGRIMYATCSIEPTENDGVIEKVLAQIEKARKKGAQWKIELGWGDKELHKVMEERLASYAERTTYGWIVLPDRGEHGNWGPLFFAPMTKVTCTG